MATFPGEPPLVGAAFADLILKSSKAGKRRDFMFPNTGKMSGVTWMVFCTFWGLLPFLCRAYIKESKRKLSLTVHLRRFGCLMSLLDALMHCSRFGHCDGSLQMDPGDRQER